MTVTFLKTYTKTNYLALATYQEASTGWTATVVTGILSKQTSTMHIQTYFNNNSISVLTGWYTQGYAT